MFTNKQFYRRFFRHFVPALTLGHFLVNVLSYDLLLELISQGTASFYFYLFVQAVLVTMLIYTHILNLNFINRGMRELSGNVQVFKIFLTSYYNWNTLLLALILNIGLFQLGVIYSAIDWGFQGAMLGGSYFLVVFLYQRYQRFCEQGGINEHHLKGIIARHHVWLM